ncbi:MAG: LLM class F420-dependent oxidoreductase [Chloroflexota bacterium]
MKLSTRLTYGDGFVRAADRVVEMEERGLDVVWVAEAYGYDAATRLGYLAARTRSVRLGSAIFPIYSRTPALLAQTAAGLDELSNGRAILGLGASGPQVIEGWHGVPYTQPMQRTREIIEICRMVWRREVVSYAGRAVQMPLAGGAGTGLGKPLKILTHPQRPQIPIYLASMGARTVELTAELADGWLPIFFVPEKADSVWGSALRRGLAKRADGLGALEVVAGGALAIGDGLEHLRETLRPQLALYIGGMGARDKNFYTDLVRAYGYEREAEVIQDLYLSGRKKEAEAAVPLELLQAISLIGPAGYVRDRIAAFKAAGVTALDILPIGPNPLDDVSHVKTLIA